MKIILQFDPSFAGAPVGEAAALQHAVAILDNLITDPITVTIDVGLDEAGGETLGFEDAGLSIPTGLQSYSYSQVLNALTTHASSPLAQELLAAFPSQAAAGQSIELLPAQAYALGLATPAAGAVDGYIGFGGALPVDASLTDYLHELTHALGRHRGNTLMDLYTYTAPGVLADGNTANAYFSIDGGKTSLGQLNPDDPADFVGNLPHADYTSGTTEIDLLTALGFTINPAPAITAQIPFRTWSGTSFSDQISADYFHSAQTLTYSATLADGSPLPSWVTFDPATLTFSGALPSGVSTASIKLTASNSLGSASETFDVGTQIHTVTDQIIPETVHAGGAFSINLNDLFTGPINAQTQFTLSLTKQDGQGVQLWSGTGIPSWLTIDPVTHILSGTMPTQAGIYNLFVGAWNPDGNVSIGGLGALVASDGMSTVSLDLSTATAPTTTKPNISVAVGWGQNFTVQLPNPVFTDSSATITSVTFNGQDALARTQYTSPPPLPWTSFDPTTATISGTAPTSGSNLYHLSLVATDSNQSSGSDEIYVFLGGSITSEELYNLNSIQIPIPVHTIADSWANITSYANIIDAHAASNGITTIQITDAGPITLLGGDVQTYASILAMVSTPSEFAVEDMSSGITAVLDQLESMAAAGTLASISLVDGGTPTLYISAAQLANDAPALEKVISPYNLQVSGGAVSAAHAALFASHIQGTVAIADSAANVSANLDALETLAKSGDISSIALTDSGTPALSITTSQITSDADALKDIAGTYSIVQIAPANGATIFGLSTTQGNTVQFAGSASLYSFASDGDGFTVTSSAGTDHLSNVQALKFSDATLIVAQPPGPASAVTTGNVTELYSAVLGREPDVGGLEFYQTYLAANPKTPLTSFAQWFLASSEYTGNPAHDYAQTPAGEAQFITDSYQSLLGRTPGASEITFYQNVITPFTQNLTPGTAAYAKAETQAHALVLTYFSQSGEFFSDVQVTAQNPGNAQHWLVLA